MVWFHISRYIFLVTLFLLTMRSRLKLEIQEVLALAQENCFLPPPPMKPCLYPGGPLLSYHIFDHHSSESFYPNEHAYLICSTDLRPQALYGGRSKLHTLLNATFTTWTLDQSKSVLNWTQIGISLWVTHYHLIQTSHTSPPSKMGKTIILIGLFLM